MTFANEDVRLAFHQLPTETQVYWENWEHGLAQRGRRLHIYEIRPGNPLEIIIGLFENFSLDAAALPSNNVSHADDLVRNQSLRGLVDD